MEQERLPIGRRQTFDSLFDPDPQFLKSIRILLLQHLLHGFEEMGLCLIARLVLQLKVHTPVIDHGKEIATERTVDHHLFPMFPQPEERVLCNLFRLFQLDKTVPVGT